MIINLKRVAFTEGYTIGKLYLEEQYFCDTLEDADRGLCSYADKRTNEKRKVKGKTAIPYGTYEVIISYSDRFKQPLPLLVGVPCFSGVRIHSGNTEEDTEGCILVGKNKIKGKVIESRTTFAALFNNLKHFTQKEKVFIKIFK